MNADWKRLVDSLPRAPGYGYDWDALCRIKPLASWFNRMARTPQQPEWHGEGDVLAHTRLVCEALCGMEAFREMVGDARAALATAALLHDIGKPACTRMENGKWVSPRHGPVGARLARGLLWRDFELCGSDAAMRLREAICLLIDGHTKPPHFIEWEDDGELRLLKLAADGELAPAFTLNALCLLAEADALGRVAPDIGDYLDNIALGRALAREAGCLEGPYPFESPRTRRALFSGANVWKGQILFDDTWGEVVMMCGLPGVGKDTWISAHCPDRPVVSLDALRREMGVSPEDNQGRVVQAAKEQARVYLRDRRPFVWNATSLTPLRSRQIELFERYGARVRVVYLETELEENLRRNGARKAAVPEGVFGRMLDRLEPPRRFEAQRVDWIAN